jgi:UDP-GlcNAc:undecaprenyl-phosphate GlcNAc-1-phosphate transferase
LHSNPVSRMGGLGIALSILVGAFQMYSYFPKEMLLIFLLMIAFIPVFVGGLIEDITKKVSPSIRLSLAFLSATAVIMVTQTYITRVDIFYLDFIFLIPGVSTLITIFLIAGFINSFNIIDGLNGLASGAAIIMITGFSIIAYLVNDYGILIINFVILIPIIVFIGWNWPLGKIFLGDAGAYLLGVWVVVLGVILFTRNSTISPVASLLICIYPIIETLFTIYRRIKSQKNSVINPDDLHLHSLIYKYIVLNNFNKNIPNRIIMNSNAAIYLWFYVMIDTIFAVIFFKNTLILSILVIISISLYIFIYIYIHERVKFRKLSL